MNIKDKHEHSSLITVIVPVYNVELYLKRCLESIINQTYKNLEIILINDGSTDSSGIICDDFKNKDSRIKVVHQENRGQSVARNAGLRIAKGAYISFIDSDDWIELEMFDKLISLMISNDLEIIECDIIPSNEDKESIKMPSDLVIENVSECLVRVIEKEKFSVCRRIYKNELLEGISFIPDKLYEDLFYTIEVLRRIEKIGYFKYPFYIYYRERSDSTMRSSYNLKKLNSIDAGMFVVTNTMSFNSVVRKSANNYMVKFLSQHYNQLIDFPQYDPNNVHKKNIRKTIRQYYPNTNFMLYPFLIKSLPYWIYRIFYNINSARVRLRSQLNHP